MKIRMLCLLFVLCLCFGAALAEDDAYMQLAEDVLTPAQKIEVDYEPMYGADTLTALVNTAKERNLDTADFEWLAEQSAYSCIDTFIAMANAAYGPDITSLWSLEQQYRFAQLLCKAGITDYMLYELPDESDMTVDEVCAHAAALLYWNYGVTLSDDGSIRYGVQYVTSGLNEDDYCWDVQVIDAQSEDTIYVVTFTRQGELLFANGGEDLLTAQERYLLQMPLAFVPLAEQQRILGAEACPLLNYRSLPLEDEPTADEVIAMAIDDVVNGRGIDLRTAPATGEEVRSVIDTLQLGVSCCRWNVDADTPVVNWVVYMVDDPSNPAVGYRVTYFYHCDTKMFDEAWINDVTDWTNG